MVAPICAAICSTSGGSKLAPQASGTGKMAAVQAVNPARHSSWAMAGMPNRPAATIWRCARASASAPSRAVTGLVPNGRVSWPSPSRMSSGQSAAPSSISSWSGATPPEPSAERDLVPSGVLAGHVLRSWPAFSARVIRRSRSATRSSAGRETSRHVASRAAPASASPVPGGGADPSASGERTSSWPSASWPGPSSLPVIWLLSVRRPARRMARRARSNAGRERTCLAQPLTRRRGAGPDHQRGR